MALSDMQLRQLRAKLDARYVKTRKANGTDLHYVEGWHVISEANRIFGYDAWDRRTVATKCVSNSGNGQRHFAAYTAKVRIAVRALCGRAQGPAKAVALLLVRRMRLLSRAPRPTPPSGRSPHSAIPSASPFMIESNWVFASVGIGGAHQP